MTKTKRTQSAKTASIEDQEWLAQFEPVADEQLTPKQRKFVTALRQQFATGRAGFRNGLLCFYATGSVTGRFVGPLPHVNE